MSTSDADRIARRYPKRGLWDYLLFGGLGLGIGLAMVLTVIAGLEHSNPPAVASVRSFTVESPTEIDVELLVQRTDPSKPATCEVTAQAESYEGVGEITAEIPPADEKVVSHVVRLTTVKEPSAVDVKGCRLIED